LRILVCQIVRMIIAICKERAFTGTIISTVAKHNRKIYPQALVATEQLIFLEASHMSSYQQTRPDILDGWCRLPIEREPGRLDNSPVAGDLALALAANRKPIESRQRVWPRRHVAR
jgi:hypothetical protein